MTLAAERRRPSLRVLNYHSVPARYATAFAKQLDLLRARYRPAPADELECLARDGVDEPTCLLTFDDGLANHLEVAAPLLEERGMTSIFAVPAAFPDVPAERQRAWFHEHVYNVVTELHDDADDVRALTWSQVAELAERGHRISSHSATHARLSAAMPAERLYAEIVESRATIEQKAGVAVEGFSWPVLYHHRATDADALVRSHYRFALVGSSRRLRAAHDPFRIPRTNLEASWPADVVELQLSPVLDLRSALPTRIDVAP